MTRLTFRNGITLISLTMFVLAGSACHRKAAPAKSAATAQDALPAFEPGSKFAQARALHEAGRYHDAIDRYKTGLRDPSSPYHPLAMFHLADAYFQVKDVEHAANEYRAAWTATLGLDMENKLSDAMKEEAHARFLQLLNFEVYSRQSGGLSPEMAARLPDAQAVAAKLANPQYELRNSEVFDKQTGLTWKRCLVGQSMDDGVRCTGDATHFRWEQIGQLNSAGWRVPTTAELLTLADNSRKRKPWIDTAVFPGMDGYMHTWSSEPPRPNSAQVVSFGGTPVSESSVPISMSVPVRLVRDGR